MSIKNTYRGATAHGSHDRTLNDRYDSVKKAPRTREKERNGHKLNQGSKRERYLETREGGFKRIKGLVDDRYGGKSR